MTLGLFVGGRGVSPSGERGRVSPLDVRQSPNLLFADSTLQSSEDGTASMHGLSASWEFEDERWLPIRGPQFAASIRVVSARTLCEPDGCCHEAAGLLRHLFGASDPDALGGRRAISTLWSMLRQFGAQDPSTPVILQAIRRPVMVMRTEGEQESIVRPKGRTRELHGDRLRLILYHSGAQMAMPMGSDSLRLFWPDRRYRTLTTVETHERALMLGSSGRAAVSGQPQSESYSGVQRALCTHPDTLDALRKGKPVPFAAMGPAINLARLSRRASGGYTSVRFGINFTTQGEFISSIWTKVSDFASFLNVYSPQFKHEIERLLPEDHQS